MAKVVTMGELLLRLSTVDNKKFIQAESYNACYGGSEANVAVSLSVLGHQAKFVTKLPDNAIGRSAEAKLKTYGVDTSDIIFGGDKMGIYFMEVGSVHRLSNVVYDRAGSAISKAQVSEFDFDRIFEGADWFHISGITPALSESCKKIALEAVKQAKKRGITVSCDMNFRKKLWSVEEAMQTMPQILKYVDVCIGSRGDAAKNLGMHLSKTNEDDTPNLEAFEQLSKEMTDRFGFKYVVTTLRQSYTASHNDLAACIYDGSEFYCTTKYSMPQMVDRVGGGDAFAAGLIAALLDEKSPSDACEFAVAASVLKHTIPGDFNLSAKTEVENLLNGHMRISR